MLAYLSPDAGCRMPDAGCRMPDAGCVDGVVDRSHTPSVGSLLHFERFQVIFVPGAPEPHMDDVAGIEVVDVLGQF